MKEKKLLIVIMILLASSFLFSQSKREPKVSDIAITGYRNINLGMSKLDVIKAINDDLLMTLPKTYSYNNDSDIQGENIDNFLNLAENKFFKSGYFLFKDDSLYSIIIRFQPRQLDFVEILNFLNEKYGEGNFIDASSVSWENQNILLTVDRSSTVKYFNKNAIDTNESATTNSIENSRQSLFEGL